jgi:hypothetical protein
MNAFVIRPEDIASGGGQQENQQQVEEGTA